MVQIKSLAVYIALVPLIGQDAAGEFALGKLSGTDSEPASAE